MLQLYYQLLRVPIIQPASPYTSTKQHLRFAYAKPTTTAIAAKKNQNNYNHLLQQNNMVKKKDYEGFIACLNQYKKGLIITYLKQNNTLKTRTPRPAKSFTRILQPISFQHSQTSSIPALQTCRNYGQLIFSIPISASF